MNWVEKTKMGNFISPLAGSWVGSQGKDGMGT